MRVVGLAVADDFAVDGRASLTGVLVLLQDAHACSLGQDQTGGAAIKGTIGVRIAFEDAASLVRQDQQDKRLQKRFTATCNQHIGGSSPDRAIGHSQGVEPANGIIHGRFAIALEPVANSGLSDVGDVQPGDGGIGAHETRATRVERLQLPQDKIDSTHRISNHRAQRGSRRAPLE